ncbi:hypothetical protein PR202_ga30217 [Eleusine coracana subsp. coracana]|uniref:Uncharacterized protein n=1 Tax=Eleusine coracana subsp. coracana TaxID=191504 RepID=A0AAV5DNS9_ELECO|nr:hypothetical protein PR202_ga30217 [Eleusine coracana subsp. coracana]
MAPPTKLQKELPVNTPPAPAADRRPRKRSRHRQQLPPSPPQTQQTIPSSVAAVTPPPAAADDDVNKREPDADDDVGKPAPRELNPYARPATVDPPTHRPPPPPTPHQDPPRARAGAPTAMEIHQRLAGNNNNGEQQGSRSRYYHRTQKLFDVWMRKLTWLPTSPKKDLVKLELALFYLSQGKIDNAYNTTRSLISREGLKTEPILNLIHGLISYDKWYSGLPKDMQVEELDVYNVSSANSMATDGCEASDLLDNSDDSSLRVHDDASSHACSSERLLEKSLLPLRLNPATEISNDCFDSYWRYKSAPNSFYEDAEKCLRLALHSNPPVMAALLPLIQLLLLGDKLKDALNELQSICNSSSTALPFRLRGRLLECFDENQVLTISCCYEEALRIDATCSYSIERLITMHRKETSLDALTTMSDADGDPDDLSNSTKLDHILAQLTTINLCLDCHDFCITRTEKAQARDNSAHQPPPHRNTTTSNSSGGHDQDSGRRNGPLPVSPL